MADYGASHHSAAIDVSKVTDDDLQGIVELKTLTLIYLISTKITDKGVVHLAKLPHLSEVWLQRTAISDEGLLKLANLTELTMAR